MLRMYLLQAWFSLSDEGVDAGAGHVHFVTATAASVHDLDQVARLVRADDMAKNLNHLGVLFASANWVMRARAVALMG